MTHNDDSQDFFRILKKRKHETDNINLTQQLRSGEMLKLKLIELVRRNNLDSDSIGDQPVSESEPPEMVEVELGNLSLPLDIDLETNRTRIEAFLRDVRGTIDHVASSSTQNVQSSEGRSTADGTADVGGEEDFYYVDGHAETEYEPLQKSRELTLLRDFLNDDEVLRIRRDIQNCHIDSKDNR